MKYICELCGMVYDEEKGDPKHGVPAGTAFSSLPEFYECPRCGSEREAFSKAARTPQAAVPPCCDTNIWHKMKYSDHPHESER